MYRFGIINNFIILNHNNNKRIKFSIFFYKNLPYFKKIITLSTNSKKFYVSYNTLKFIKTIFKSSIIIISSNQGLISHQEALYLGTGGKLVYLIL